MSNKITTKINVKDNLIGNTRIYNRDYFLLTDLLDTKMN